MPSALHYTQKGFNSQWVNVSTAAQLATSDTQFNLENLKGPRSAIISAITKINNFHKFCLCKPY